MTGPLGMTNNKIVDLADGDISATSQDAVNGRQLYQTNQAVAAAQTTAVNAQTLAAGALQTTGGTMSGNIDMGGTNKATNMANGSLTATSTDAVTGQQLYATNQNVTTAQNAATAAQTATGNLTTGLSGVAASFGGGATYNGTTGAFTQPTYTVQGSNYTNVGSALSALDSAIAAAGGDAVQYDSAAHTNVTLGGTSATSPVGLTNLKAGTLSAASTDAVNGAQLYATNQNVAAAQTTANTALTAANGALQRTGGTMSGNIDMAGNQVTGLANAALTATSTDAVTGQQLYATNQAVAGLDGRVTTLESNVNGVINGTAGLVQQNPTTRAITVGAGTDGTVVNVAGTAGTRTVTGVSNGTLSASSTDAVTGQQLYATNGRVTTLEQRANASDATFAQVASSLGGGSSYDPATRTLTAPSYALSTGTYGSVGTALASIDGDVVALRSSSVQYDSTAKDKVTLGGVGATTKVALTNLKDGTVAAGSSDAVTGGQLNTTNLAVARAQTTADGALQRTGGTMTGNIDMGGTNKVTGLADATLAANSTDAVTGSQLYATNNRVATAENAIVVLDHRTQATDTRLAALTDDVTSGRIGLVQQTGGSPSEGELTVGASTGGTTVNFGGTSGYRTLTGVRSGAVARGSSDAINGDQFYSLQMEMRSGLGALDGRVTTLEKGFAQVNFDLGRLRRDMNSAVATSAALASMPMSVNPGRFVFGSGMGLRGGEFAAALGLSYRTKDDFATFNLRAGYDTNKVTVGAGLGVEF